MITTPDSDDIFWTPSAHHIATSNLSAFARYLNTTYNACITIGDQNALHLWSITHPRLFWLSVAAFLSFPLDPTPPLQSVVVPANVPHLPGLVNVRWFDGCFTNVAAALLRFAAITPDMPAIIYRPESRTHDKTLRSVISFRSLQQRVMRLAAALRAAGVVKGASVSAVLPNTPQAVVAMLAVAAVGAVWSACAPDFRAHAIASRLRQTQPVVLFYTPAYWFKDRAHNVAQNIEEVTRQLPTLRIVIAVPDALVRDAPFASVTCTHEELYEFERRARGTSLRETEFARMGMDDPLVTMFSSGTTGAPKCLVQGAGIVLNQMKEHSLHLEITSRSVVLFLTSTAWMLHNWLIACLATGATIVLYDGAPIPPRDPQRVVHIAEQERVTHFGSGAAYLHALQSVVEHNENETGCDADNMAGQRMRTLRMVLATGSPSTVEHFRFVSRFFPRDVPYVSMSGGTEINGCFALGSPWLPVRAPQLQCAGLGMDVAVYNDDGVSVVGCTGELVCRNPCPCMPLYFSHDEEHHQYRSAYFETFGDHVWSHGDFAVATAVGGFIISGRSDATLNPGGVRIGTADLYEVVDGLPFVADSLVTDVGVATGSDVRMVMFVVLVDGILLDEARLSIIRDAIRKHLSPRHVPKDILQVSDVPYTFSGKKCEIPVRNMLRGIKKNHKEAVKNPQTFNEIHDVAKRFGLFNTVMQQRSRL